MSGAECALTGTLHKRGGMIKTWKVRYCELRNGTLYYYVDRAHAEQGKLQGKVEIKPHTVHEADIENGFTFETSTGRIFVAYADSKVEQLEWIETLQQQPLQTLSNAAPEGDAEEHDSTSPLLVVTVMGAQGVRSQSCYCTLTTSSRVLGQTQSGPPSWEESFTLRLTPDSTTLFLSVVETAGAKLLGKCRLTLDIPVYGESTLQEHWHALVLPHKAQGAVRVRTEIRAPRKAAMNTMNPLMAALAEVAQEEEHAGNSSVIVTDFQAQAAAAQFIPRPVALEQVVAADSALGRYLYLSADRVPQTGFPLAPQNERLLRTHHPVRLGSAEGESGALLLTSHRLVFLPGCFRASSAAATDSALQAVGGEDGAVQVPLAGIHKLSSGHSQLDGGEELALLEISCKDTRTYSFSLRVQAQQGGEAGAEGGAGIVVSRTTSLLQDNVGSPPSLFGVPNLVAAAALDDFREEIKWLIAEDDWRCATSVAHRPVTVEELYAQVSPAVASAASMFLKKKGARAVSLPSSTQEKPTKHSARLLATLGKSASKKILKVSALEGEEEILGSGAHYDVMAEIARQGVLRGNSWRVSSVNQRYSFSPTYPQQIVVPATVSDTVLSAASKYRTKQRLPALSWIHPNGSALCRSSQPRAGLANRTSAHDKFLLLAILDASLPPNKKLGILDDHELGADSVGMGDAIDAAVAAAAVRSETESKAFSPDEDDDAEEEEYAAFRGGGAGGGGGDEEDEEDEDVTVPSRASTVARGGDASSTKELLRVVDCRPLLNARGNAFKGAGTEHVKTLVHRGRRFVSLQFMNIANIHVMRDSLQKFGAACHQLDDDDNYYAQVGSSRWMNHVSGVLKGGIAVADHLEAGEPVLVHCSDGWDRTSQLSAMGQLLLDPYFRTIEGFGVLVEKDWCSFGHMFKKRSGTDHEASPIFLQFLDAVYQVMQQFSAEFEFNSAMLVFLVDALYSQWFRNFQGNSERDRAAAAADGDMLDVWDFIAAHKPAFTNQLYCGSRAAELVSTGLRETKMLRPATTLRALRVWRAFYMREDVTVAAALESRLAEDGRRLLVAESELAAWVLGAENADRGGSDRSFDVDEGTIQDLLDAVSSAPANGWRPAPVAGPVPSELLELEVSASRCCMGRAGLAVRARAIVNCSVQQLLTQATADARDSISLLNRELQEGRRDADWSTTSHLDGSHKTVRSTQFLLGASLEFHLMQHVRTLVDGSAVVVAKSIKQSKSRTRLLLGGLLLVPLGDPKSGRCQVTLVTHVRGDAEVAPERSLVALLERQALAIAHIAGVALAPEVGVDLSPILLPPSPFRVGAAAVSSGEEKEQEEKEQEVERKEAESTGEENPQETIRRQQAQIEDLQRQLKALSA